ncbi:MAG TPA: porin family protein [Gemmatimonadales bacterium]|nr:porin family protein [Gemmatimonadales bacterium]
MIRTLTCLIATAVGLTTVAPAQGGVALKGGFSYGNVSNSGVLPGSLHKRTGFAVGLSAGSNRNMLGFGIEALYAQRGVSGSAPDERRLDYVDVPVFLRALFPSPGIAPFAYAGPQVSFELRCRAGGGTCPATDRPSTSYAAVIGGGARLGAASAFMLEGRYVYGLTDLKISTVTSSDSYKTRSFLILAGWAF